jgi:hypothetical protein
MPENGLVRFLFKVRLKERLRNELGEKKFQELHAKYEQANLN